MLCFFSKILNFLRNSNFPDVPEARIIPGLVHKSSTIDIIVIKNPKAIVIIDILQRFAVQFTGSSPVDRANRTLVRGHAPGRLRRRKAAVRS